MCPGGSRATSSPSSTRSWRTAGPPGAGRSPGAGVSTGPARPASCPRCSIASVPWGCRSESRCSSRRHADVCRARERHRPDRRRAVLAAVAERSVENDLAAIRASHFVRSTTSHDPTSAIEPAADPDPPPVRFTDRTTPPLRSTSRPSRTCHPVRSTTPHGPPRRSNPQPSGPATPSIPQHRTAPPRRSNPRPTRTATPSAPRRRAAPPGRSNPRPSAVRTRHPAHSTTPHKPHPGDRPRRRGRALRRADHVVRKRRYRRALGVGETSRHRCRADRVVRHRSLPSWGPVPDGGEVSIRDVPGVRVSADRAGLGRRRVRVTVAGGGPAEGVREHAAPWVVSPGSGLVACLGDARRMRTCVVILPVEGCARGASGLRRRLLPQVSRIK